MAHHKRVKRSDQAFGLDRIGKAADFTDVSGITPTVGAVCVALQPMSWNTRRQISAKLESVGKPARVKEASRQDGCPRERMDLVQAGER